MAIRKPLVVISGSTSELPPGDLVEGVVYTTILTAGSGLSGGGSLSINQRIDAQIASQAVAQSGTDNTTLMTPLRVSQLLAINILPTYSSTNVNKTLSNLERCTVTSGSVILTLPTGPLQGNEVSVIVPSSPSVNVVLSGAGSAIMGLQQNLIIDSVDKTVTLVYIDATYGWRIF